MNAAKAHNDIILIAAKAHHDIILIIRYMTSYLHLIIRRYGYHAWMTMSLCTSYQLPLY